MGSSQFLSCFLLSIFFPFFYRVNGQEICQTYLCGDTGPAIRFPFRIKGLQPESCGFPGFDLKCSYQGRRILELPSSGNFWLHQIDYAKQEIGIGDPDNCLWRRLQSLNLSGSPFREVNYEDYTMLSCSTALVMALPPPPSKPIDCMSNSSYQMWATASMTDALMMKDRGCEVIATVAVPVPWAGYYDNGETSFSDLSEDLILTWDVPQCVDCVKEGGRCGLISNSSFEVGCFDVPRHGLSRGVSYAVTIGVGIPALLCAIGIACYVGGRVKSYRYRRRNSYLPEAGSSSTVNPQPTVSVTGLDDPTIESYPKVVVGESRRLSQLNDNPCSICLAEYQPKETIRTIPQCQHCFHANCIDEWLRTNATCPLCRISPTPV